MPRRLLSDWRRRRADQAVLIDPASDPVPLTVESDLSTWWVQGYPETTYDNFDDAYRAAERRAREVS